MKYRLGLDIGIASVGWSVMEYDEQDNPKRIVDLGVRIFPPAEKPKTGESPAVDRRNARGIRRVIRRRRHRLDKISQFLKDNLLDGNPISFSGENIYELRVKALDEKISNNDLGRIIYHLAKHRGFKSNRKSELKTGDSKKMLGFVNGNSEESKKYRSVGEMYLKNPQFYITKQKVEDGKVVEYKVYNTRNKAGMYDKTILREDILNELKIILLKQKEYGNAVITEDFINKIVHYLEYQKSYDEGPDYPSPYRVTFNVGNCTFFKDEKRAPKASFSYEYFTALCDINNLKINYNPLTQQQRELLINEFLTSDKVTYKKVRKLLKLSSEDKITGKSGSNKDDKIFVKREFSHAVLKTLGLSQSPLDHVALLDNIAYVISMFKSDERRLKEFNKNEIINKLTAEQKQSLCELDFNKFGNLSVKALKMIIPYLEKGEIYFTACESANLKLPNFTKSIKLKYNLLPEIADITSPVVKRAVSQTIKVVNAIIDKYGSPAAIFIELARDMSLGYSDRKKMEKEMDNNQDNNDKRVAKLKELGIANPSGLDILKLRLYYEQDGKCAYSGKSFLSVFGGLQAIFTGNNTQIDHIIPYSRCFDDSLSNKVLVISDENQKKGNKLPYEYFGNDEQRWQEFEARVESWQKSTKKKKENCLKKSLSLDEERELNNRALNDTRYISKFMKNLLENHLIFEDSSLSKKPVRTVNGRMTSFLRKIWGIRKERFADDKHHAVDATIVACTDNGMIQRATTFMQTTKVEEIDNETIFIDKQTGNTYTLKDMKQRYGEKYQQPYDWFKEELNLRLLNKIPNGGRRFIEMGYPIQEVETIHPINVSRMVNHKVKGSIHKDTIRSKKLYNANDKKTIVVTKTPLKELKLKDGEIEDYPVKFRSDDKKLYEMLRARLIEFNGDAKLAFKEPVYKPAKAGATKNIVKSVKLQSEKNDGVEVNGGIAENGSMIRIDVFEKNGKNYFIPVYVKDYYNKTLPNKICKAGKKYGEWPELTKEYKFKFSLYPNDLLKVEGNSDISFVPCDKKAPKDPVQLNNIFVYYIGAGRSTASIIVETMDGKYVQHSLGIQNLKKIEKYQVDVLGNISKVNKEDRKEFV